MTIPSVDKFKIDGLRFIDNLHTTNRQLGICSKIVDELKNRQVPKSILISKLIAWSDEKEASDEIYRFDKGKITNQGRPTTALSHYLSLCEALNIITKFSDVYSSTRLSYVLSFFRSNNLKLSLGEKLFYSYQLFNIDADGLIIILEILFNSDSQKINQKDFQVKFSKTLEERLQYKRQFSSGNAKFNISNKLIKVHLLWKSPIKYAEHMVAPRCEWLATLGLVSIEKLGSSTVYSLTQLGRVIYHNFPNINEFSGNRDINNKWIEDYFFTIFGNLDESSIVWSKENNSKEIHSAFSKSIVNIKSSNSFRLPLLDTFLFICIYMLEYYRLRMNISELMKLFKDGFNHDGKKFYIRGSGRINESYITSTLL